MMTLTANTVIKAMVGGSALLKEYVKGEVRYWIFDPKKRSHIAVPAREGKQLEDSSLVEPCDPGLFEGYPQSFVIKRRVA
jgi:hypothetical protein